MLLGTLEGFHTSIEHNRGFIPRYSKRDHYGKRISTSFVESPLNQEARALRKELS
jgi:hypothetical protein